jgi:hypothetical protein
MRRALLAAVLIALPGAALACIPGNRVTCPPGIAPDPGRPIAPLTRADINARIGTPGAPIGDKVTEDTARTWEAVRRQPRAPAIVYPHSDSHIPRKGGTP